MGFFLTRASLIATYSVELLRHGLVESAGDLDHEAIFILDGVGGFQFMPLLIRRVLREQGESIGTIMVRWQWGLPGEIWTDLMWHSRNRKQAAKLADQITAFRKAHPNTRLHMIAYSGGCGVAAWACECLTPDVGLETLILACPALSPAYNLGRCLQNVRRCYALVSEKDRVVLGLGTTVFGTVDRQFCSAAGCVGCRRPADLASEEQAAYERLRQIAWTPAFRRFGHRGGHPGWASLPFLHQHLLPLLRGEPKLDTKPVL